MMNFLNLRTLHKTLVLNRNSLYRFQCYSDENSKDAQSSSTTSPEDDKEKKLMEDEKEKMVPGLSSEVFRIPDHDVGPGASKTGVYKNAEYFCYHRFSFYNAEVELIPYRLPQPSSLKPEK